MFSWDIKSRVQLFLPFNMFEMPFQPHSYLAMVHYIFFSMFVMIFYLLWLVSGFSLSPRKAFESTLIFPVDFLPESTLLVPNPTRWTFLTAFQLSLFPFELPSLPLLFWSPFSTLPSFLFLGLLISFWSFCTFTIGTGGTSPCKHLELPGNP